MLYGSSVLLSTLTPNITALEPRLDTGCWLDITRLELPQLYDISLNPPKKIAHFIFKVCYFLLAYYYLAEFW